jgi:hypothetical protein
MASNSVWLRGHASKSKLLVTWSSRLAAIFVCLLAFGILLRWAGGSPGAEGTASGNAGMERICAVARLFGGVSFVTFHGKVALGCSVGLRR